MKTNASSPQTRKLLPIVLLGVLGLIGFGCAPHDQPASTKTVSRSKAQPVKHHTPTYENHHHDLAAADDFQINTISGNYERNPPFGPRGNKWID